LAEGYQSHATGLKSTAIGGDTVASGSQSTAIGWGSVATAANTVSFGNSATNTYRELVNIADPTAAHSAVNLEYFNAHTSALVAEMTQLQNEISAMQVANTGAVSAASQALATTPASASNASASSAQAAAPPRASSEAVQQSPAATAPTGVQNVASASTRQTQQAVTSASVYTDQQTSEALSTAQTYTDAQNVQTLNSAKAYTDQAISGVEAEVSALGDRVDALDTRVDQLDDRIGRVAALGAAMSMTSPDARINKDNQVGMGVGTYRNHSALGIGYSHLISPSASVRAGIAVGGGGDNSAGVGVNFGWWNLGNRRARAGFLLASLSLRPIRQHNPLRAGSALGTRAGWGTSQQPTHRAVRAPRRGRARTTQLRPRSTCSMRNCADWRIVSSVRRRERHCAPRLWCTRPG